MSVLPFFDQWSQYNRRIVEVVAPMTDEQLALSHVAGGWPIWATVGHMAGVRIYWLCLVAGEPGIETTPFSDPANAGWEDDLDHPRGADELVPALESTFAVIEGVLERWTPETVGESVTRSYAGVSRDHTRSEILQRLFTHDAYHSGELSQTLGILDLPQIDLWR